MTKASAMFEKHARKLGDYVDLSRGPYGELLNPRTRELWFFWYGAWKARAKDIKARQAKREAR